MFCFFVEKNKFTKATYTLETLKDALVAVESGFSYNKASKAFGIPKTTLIRKSKNTLIEIKRCGLECILGKSSIYCI